MTTSSGKTQFFSKYSSKKSGKEQNTQSSFFVFISLNCDAACRNVKASVNGCFYDTLLLLVLKLVKGTKVNKIDRNDLFLFFSHKDIQILRTFKNSSREILHSNALCCLQQSSRQSMFLHHCTRLTRSEEPFHICNIYKLLPQNKTGSSVVCLGWMRAVFTTSLGLEPRVKPFNHYPSFTHFI